MPPACILFQVLEKHLRMPRKKNFSDLLAVPLLSEPFEDADKGEQQQLNAAKFILKTREGKLTQVAMNGVVHDVQTMVQSTLEAVEQKFLDMIKTGGIASTVRPFCLYVNPLAQAHKCR